jgi:hypothetical protein
MASLGQIAAGAPASRRPITSEFLPVAALYNLDDRLDLAFNSVASIITVWRVRFQTGFDR